MPTPAEMAEAQSWAAGFDVVLAASGPGDFVLRERRPLAWQYR